MGVGKGSCEIMEVVSFWLSIALDIVSVSWKTPTCKVRSYVHLCMIIVDVHVPRVRIMQDLAAHF